MFSGKRLVAVGLAVLVLAALATVVIAQGGAITYGSSVTGSLSAAAPFAIYSFNGNPGDLITVYAIGITPGLTPSLSLLGPTQVQLAVSDSDPFGGGSPGTARITYRLVESGLHSLLVSSPTGGAGEFLLRLDGRPTVASTSLSPEVPVVVNVLPGSLPVTYSFIPLPDADSMLTLSTNSPGFAFLVQVYDGRGQLIAGLAGDNVRGTTLTVGPGTGVYEVTVKGLRPEMQGAVQVMVGAPGSTAAGGWPAQPTQPPAPVVTQEPALTVCRVTSGINVNVRRGPGTEYDIIGSLFAGTYLTVTGQNSTGTWFVVNYNNSQGWVANSVVTLEGPCNNLMPIAAPPPPTPGPPTAVPTAPPPAFTPTAQISFLVNGAGSATITSGSCATVQWQVQNVSAVYYEGTGVSGSGSTAECPTTTTSYVLQVQLLDGTTTTRTVTINVTPLIITLPPFTLMPLPPIIITLGP